MTKRPDIIKFASKNSFNELSDFQNLPNYNGDEACLIVEDLDFFYSEFALDISLAKDICIECPMMVSCRDYAIKHENYGVWGGLSAKERHAIRGNREALETHEITQLLTEAKYILNTPAEEVAKTYDVDPRTVARWRNTIREPKQAS